MQQVPGSRTSVLSRPTYSLAEAARLLQVAHSTLRWWLEGAQRRDGTYRPVIRSQPTGSTILTWGEFIEAGYLREYRRDISLQRLRPLIEALRCELDTPYPLASAHPLIGGKQLVWNLQQKLNLPEELWIVVGEGQLVLAEPAMAFFKRVEFDPDTGESLRYTVMRSEPPVLVDPHVAFALPTVRGVRTEALAELAEAGEPPGAVAGIYCDYGITVGDVATALSFEREYMQPAA